MNYRKIYTIVALLFCVVSTYAQNVKLIRKKYNYFSEEYYALKNDTSVKHGRYVRKYKKYPIERGAYKNGNKTGKWIYFSLDGHFEFEYNYDANKVSKIANRQTPDEYFETPVFFDGSPLIPYIYIVNHVRYPYQAKRENIKGKITLAVCVNKEGKPIQLYLKEKLHPLLDKEVMNAAKSFPRHWNWIPATYHGQNIDSEYHIDIEFELME